MLTSDERPLVHGNAYAYARQIPCSGPIGMAPREHGRSSDVGMGIALRER